VFAGEVSKRFRIALDENAGLPKTLHLEGNNPLVRCPPLSELIMHTAVETLSKEALLCSSEESSGRLLEQEGETNRMGDQLM
jgi:hypothetical protein